MIKEHEKNNKRYIFAFAIIGLLILGASAVQSETLPNWFLNDDTVVLTNSSNNVNIGENETTDFKLNVNGTLCVQDNVYIPRNYILNFGIPFVDDAYIYSPISDNLNITSTSLDITGSVSCHNGLGIENGNSLTLKDETGDKSTIASDLDIMYFKDADLYHFDDNVKTNVGFISLGESDYNSYKDTHYGDNDTYRVFTTDAIQFYCGGWNFLRLYKGAFFGTGAVINYLSEDIDLTVKGDTDPVLLFTDASTGRVGISTNTPAYEFDVDGTIRADNYRSNDNSLGWTGTFTNGDGATVTVKNGLITGVV